MQKRRSYKKALAFTVAAACLFSAGTEIAAASKLNLGYLYFGTQEAFVRQVDATNQAVNRVSPTLFDLTSDGELQLASDISGLVAAMKDRDVQVVPFLSNHWDRETGRRALANREQLTTQIARAVIQYELDGVNVDIENVTEQDRDAYTDLVRLLRAKLPAGTELSVAIAANPSGWTKGWQGSYDLAKLAEYSDYLMLMAYDEHWSGQAESGPVASLGWVEKSVQQVLKTVAPEQLVLGIPLYGRYWSEDGRVLGAGIPNQTAENLAQRYGITSQWDETARSPYFTFTVGDNEQRPVVNGAALAQGTYTVWYENERSIKEKLDLVHRYNLKGTGVWCLSQESSDTWTYYASWLNGQYYIDALGHWAEADIRQVARQELMMGTGSITFAPDKPMTRAEAAAVLVRLARSWSVEDSGGTAVDAGSFSDVPAGYWGAAEIAAARSMGLVEGYGNGSFAPEQAVTREQFAAMAYRLLQRTAAAGFAPENGAVLSAGGGIFPDVPPERWSWIAVSAMGSRGILQGYEDGAFRPDSPILRGEAAALLLRLDASAGL